MLEEEEIMALDVSAGVLTLTVSTGLSQVSWSLKIAQWPLQESLSY